MNRTRRGSGARYISQEGAIAELPYQIMRRKGARHLRAWVDYRGVVILSVPWNCSRLEIMRFFEANSDLLSKQKKQIEELPSLWDFVLSKEVIASDGENRANLVLSLNKEEPRTLLKIRKRRILIQVPKKSDFLLKKALVLLAQRILPRRCRELAEQYDFDFKGITIRDQRTRWGSCSGKSNLNFNWRLILLRAELRDHIILHELCHTVELNHSSRFHALLKRVDPFKAQHEAALEHEGRFVFKMGRIDC